jgi:hypothetical protein
MVVGALAALAVAWLLVPPHSVPLYDGIGFPDEAYRYVAAPAGTPHTPAATTASASSDAVGGHNRSPFYANSAEIGPQVSVFVGTDVLVVPAGATAFTLTVTPLAPDAQPAGAQVDGNMYRVAATAGTGSSGGAKVGVRSDRQAADATVTMRATTARQPRPNFYYRPAPGQSWQRLDAARIGNDVYRTDLAGMGDYVLAFTGGSGGSGGQNGIVLTIVGVGVAAVVFGAAVLGIRLSRRRRTTP